MTLPNAILTRRRDDVSADATWTVQRGTPDTDYAPMNLVDDNPAKVAKIAATSGAWQATFAAKQPLSLVALIHHDFDEGLAVRILGDDGAAWSSPAFSRYFTIPAWQGSGTRRWPVNPWLDLEDADGSPSGAIDPLGYSKYLIDVQGTNSSTLELGQVKLYADRLTLDPDIRWGMDGTNTTRLARPLIENKTTYEVATIYAKGTVLWRGEGDLRASDALAATLEDQWHDCGGRELPFCLMPEGLENRCYLVRWATTDRTMARFFINAQDTRLAWEEVARGLRPGA